ncbi:MAG: hydroxymethylglutaryl-CoA lyase [Deltaproteobacteria bacterium]|nr:hydroxymethylglutaryl-CoA lyase [Deltaproteobacteria bacterium]
MVSLPKKIELTEVGPRDGLQNEASLIPTELKIQYIEALLAAGVRKMEVSSFVSPRAIPQLADGAEVFTKITKPKDAWLFALVPNLKGLERALAAGVQDIAVFMAASETFNKKNINMGVKESLEVIGQVVCQAKGKVRKVRGYISTAWVCPYEGNIQPKKVLPLLQTLLDLGIEEIALGETIGAAAPLEIQKLLEQVLKVTTVDHLALHFHDTRGTALANVWAALEMGFYKFDASSGGLGGCPYARGAAGNLATEDLLYALHRMGMTTGIDLEKLSQASLLIAQALGKTLPSRYLLARW